MPTTLKVKAADAAVRTQREAAAQRVLDYFGSCLPPSRLLCFLDDDDTADLKREFGTANRGTYGPIRDNTPLAIWPEYVTNSIYVDEGISFRFQRVVDDLIYLY